MLFDPGYCEVGKIFSVVLDFVIRDVFYGVSCAMSKDFNEYSGVFAE